MKTYIEVCLRETNERRQISIYWAPPLPRQCRWAVFMLIPVDTCYHFLMDINSTSVCCSKLELYFRQIMTARGCSFNFFEIQSPRTGILMPASHYFQVYESVTLVLLVPCSLTLVIIFTFLRYPFCTIFLFRQFIRLRLLFKLMLFLF